jgi:NADH-quinone oxidoreductase subunit G
MPKIIIDEIEIEAKEGETVLQAAERYGIYIPRYCYHPALSIAGNCRMCLVEIEKMPKLQTACSTLAQEGMKINTKSEKVKKARQDALEFLLLNHPLDCPICDQAGECYLQDYYMDYGLYKSRVKLEDKNRKEKRLDFGQYLILDRERCILCTRCVRFCEEITKTGELFVSNRGDHSFIDIKPGDKINNNYSLNIADICPVGAFTSKDFRFKQRAWFLKEKKSICLGCATGCKIKAHYNENKIYRIMPDPNIETNTWLCDYGRMLYKISDSKERLRHCVVDSNKMDIRSGLLKIFDRLNSQLTSDKDKILVFLSSNLSIEDNLALFYFARTVIETENIVIDDLKEQKIEDGILLNTDKTPNSKFIYQLKNKYKLKTISEIKKEDFNFIIGYDSEIKKYFPKNDGINFSFLESDTRASLFPIKTYFEQKGSFINYQGYLRETEKIIDNDFSIELWSAINKLANYFSKYIPFNQIDDFEKIISKEGYKNK